MTKLAKLKAAATAGNWTDALRIAAKFHDLGEHKEAISRAWAASQNPAFYREIGRDPDAEIEAGKSALKARYSL